MVFDILLDEVSNDLVNASGDFRTGDATNQDQFAIIISSPGHFKEFPQTGVGIWTYLNGQASSSEIERAIRVQMEADNFPNSYVDAKDLTNIIVNSINVSLK